ncbi:MAG: ATP-binding protein [Saprospiraceae bacterium]|nr:ATP-binding protein [Saprospiraceae bacterium]
MSPNILAAIDFLRALLRGQLALFLGQPGAIPPVPVFQDDNSPFTQFISSKRLNIDELVMLITALAPHVQPHLFDDVIQEMMPQGGDLPEIGGVKGTNFRGFLPTGETVVFLLGGSSNIERRLQIQRMFGSGHFFNKEKIIALEDLKPGEPIASGRLVLDMEYVERFTLGYITQPRLSSSFPAQPLSTELEWDDLILNPQTAAQLREIETWIKHNDTLLYDWGMSRKIKPGFRALFYGPPGTGKTMAATLLGKHTGKDVYRIDLSSLVSKYIGETEKNLSTLFERAENKNWILFFDEADSLFGKRTSVRDAHDRFANQEVSYLLQRIEDYSGLSILASNFKSNMDEAFTRRFQTTVFFPMPRPEERLMLWQKSFPDAVKMADDVNLKQIAEQYELSGSNIVNVVHYCCLQALSAGTNIITRDNLLNGIRRELIKENKVV